MKTRFLTEPMSEVVRKLRTLLASLGPGEREVAFEALDPDVSHTHFAGEVMDVEMNGQLTPCIYRSHKVWMELAEQLDCRYLTPHPAEGSLLTFRFARLHTQETWHENALPSGDAEKYGTDSEFFHIHKLEEPSFLLTYEDNLSTLPLPTEARVLNLGVNRGDEFLPFASVYPPELLASMRFVGIDHAASALEVARARFSGPQYQFVEADLNDLATLELGRFDLIVSIGTLHSPKLRSRDIFSLLVREHLTPAGHMVVGFPNCRYIDHELRYGAKMKNYTRPELSVLWKEVAFYKRYLQQHKFRVTITGKHTIFVTGRRLPS